MTSERTQVAIMYHRGCPDGFGAAWAAHKGNPQATFHPVKHGQKLPQIPARNRLYILDYSPSRDETLALHRRHGPENVTVIDHHVTGARALDGVDNCHFDMSRSGAVLAWEHFHGDRPRPQILDYVQDRDLWTWELPHSHEINSYLFAQGFRFDRWDRVSGALQNGRTKSELVRCGEALYQSELRTIQSICRRAHMATVAGMTVPIVNSGTHRSEVGQRLLDYNPDAPFAVIWYDDRDGLRHWSMRSRGDFDVSTVAEPMGGGGHASAASFTTPTPGITDPAAHLR